MSENKMSEKFNQNKYIAEFKKEKYKTKSLLIPKDECLKIEEEIRKLKEKNKTASFNNIAIIALKKYLEIK